MTAKSYHFCGVLVLVSSCVALQIGCVCSTEVCFLTGVPPIVWCGAFQPPQQQWTERERGEHSVGVVLVFCCVVCVWVGVDLCG